MNPRMVHRVKVFRVKEVNSKTISNDCIELLQEYNELFDKKNKVLELKTIEMEGYDVWLTRDQRVDLISKMETRMNEIKAIVGNLLGEM